MIHQRPQDFAQSEVVWKMIVSLFLLLVLGAFFFFYRYFDRTGRLLEEEPTLSANTTDRDLGQIETRVRAIESAISARTSASISSQSTPSVVQ